MTFSFDKAYSCGTFANGDYWVAPESNDGTVKITSITPTFTGTQNGFEVNPSSAIAQGFDSRASDFDAARVPLLPYAARGGESIVKGVSLATSPNDRTYLDTAVVLTVLGTVPSDSGANLFRPPYFGTDKPLYSTTNLRTDLLPTLEPVDYTPTLDHVATRFARVQLDHKRDWDGATIHPIKNMPDYGADIADDTSEAALRLMLNDSATTKMPALIPFMQYGIDLAAAVKGGSDFAANGGHRLGRKLVISLTALLLDDTGMRAVVHDAPYNTFQEDGDLHFSTKANKVLWGAPCSEADYWFNQNSGEGVGSMDCRDPYGYIDGGQSPGLEYQFCCTSKPFQYTALALRLQPALQCIWNNGDLLAYTDRWISAGAWTQPDPYAPHGNGALDTDPSDGTGRFPSAHGISANDGYYSSQFGDAMWTVYRANANSSCLENLPSHEIHQH